jgi:two-component system nitrogen regulation sensor histidine kinase NtrY
LALALSINKLKTFGSICLVAAGLVYALNSWFFSDAAYYYSEIEEDLERQLTLVDAELDLVHRSLARQPEDLFSALPTNLQHQYYIYQDRSLTFWSDYHYVPAYNNLAGNYNYRFLNLPEGQFIVIQTGTDAPKKKGDYEVFMLLPLAKQGNLESASFKYNQNIFISPDFTLQQASSETEEGIIYAADGVPLFSVQLGESYLSGPHLFLLLSALLLLLGGIAWVLALFWHSKRWMYRQKPFMAFGYLLIGLIAVRVLMLYTAFPYNMYPFALFDPRYYASSFVNPSLGDFLLNVSAVLLVVVLFLLYRKGAALQFRKWPAFQKRKKWFFIGLAALQFLLLAGLCQVLQELFFHGQFSLDITSSLDVNMLKLTSWLIFCLIAFIYISLNHLLCLFMLRILPSVKNGLGIYLALAFLLLSVGLVVWPLLIFISLGGGAYFLLFLLVERVRNGQPSPYILLLFIFCGALISSIAGSLALYHYHQQSRLIAKEHFANQMLIENDLVGEYLLSEAVEKIQEDPFIKSRFFSPLFSKEVVEQKIKRQYLTRYFDKYETNIYLFNVDGSVINHPNRYLNYHAEEAKLREGNYGTDYPGLYLINDTSLGTSAKRYQQYIPVRFGANLLGYILLELTLKRYLTNTIYPELFMGKQLQDPASGRFSYAIFRNGQLEYNAGAFDYVHQLPAGFLQQPELYEIGMEAEGYHHLAVKGTDNRVVVISDESDPLYFIISNFSFLFLLVVLCVTLGLVGYVLYFRLSIRQLDFTTKIQLYLNFAVFIPLLIVSASTLSLINSSFKADTENQYFDRAENISRNIAEILSDQPQLSESGREELSVVLDRIARYAEADIQLFNTRGNLVATNQPVIYQQNYLSTYINPLALAEIKEQNSRQIILNEVVNDLYYKSVYMAVRSTRDGSLLGILSLPFFESGYQLENQLAAVFSNIVTIFASLFVFFLVLLYLLSRELTDPLRYIATKMKQVSLSGKNEPLQWTTDDEIGKLVREYNHMLLNLQESKEALSRSEKESAWREMAKQVAHEIKNPLTPMKLSLQHLSRMLKGKLEDTREEERVEKSVKSLLEQIDTLSDIATSFSAFAKMPVPKLEQFDIAEVLQGVVRLYSRQEQPISAHIPEGQYRVLGDEQMMQRTFNNLILNGLQAVPDEREARIAVKLEASDNGRVLIEISDNGEGIDETIREKVFVPNFSTKYTGSGLGLAIAKRGIEHAGGRIWFETEKAVGTTFFIELPLTF